MHKLSVLLVAVSAGAIGVSIYLFTQLQSEREHSNALNARLTAALRHREPQFKNEPRNSEVPLAVTRSMPPANRIAATGERPVSGANPMFNRFRQRDNDPASQAARKHEQKLRLMQAYPDLAATLHLQPAEVDKLFDLLADYQTKAQDSRDALRGKNLSSEEFASALQQQRADGLQDRNHQIDALLGDAKTQQWKDYENTLGARTQVRDLSTILESSGYPLRDDQMQTLVTALAPEQNRYKAEQGNAARPENMRTMDATKRVELFEQNLAQMEKHVQASHDSLAPYLTAQQLSRYDELSAQQLESQRMNLQRIRERAARDGN